MAAPSGKLAAGSHRSEGEIRLAVVVGMAALDWDDGLTSEHARDLGGLERALCVAAHVSLCLEGVHNQSEE